MATSDVPGANAANADTLHAGCWAEHADGSLIYVKGTEGDRVVYEIYDMAMDPPAVYTDAMTRAGFEKQFSYAPTGKSTDKWTWHDKTPFDWDRVIKHVERPRPGFASAHDQLSAAARVAQSLKLKGRAIDEEELTPRTERRHARGRDIAERLHAAIDTLFGE